MEHLLKNEMNFQKVLKEARENLQLLKQSCEEEPCEEIENLEYDLKQLEEIFENEIELLSK